MPIKPFIPSGAVQDGVHESPPPLPPARILCSAHLPLKDDVVATLLSFDGCVDGKPEHCALVFAGRDGGAPLVRIHDKCLTGDTFGSRKCDCGKQLAATVDSLSVTGGVLLYMDNEGRGIGLRAKIAAYRIQQDEGLDTVDANLRLGLPVDARDHRAAGQMLLAMSIRSVRLLSNNPRKAEHLRACGIEVEMVPTVVSVNPHNAGYLATKVARCGHTLALPAPDAEEAA